AVNPPPIRELGNGGLEFYLQDRNSRGHQALVEARNKLIAEMRKNPMFGDTRAAGLEDAPQLKLTIDRAAAAAQGISMSSIRSTLGSALGGAYVNDFPNNGRLQKVYVQAVPQARMQAEQILAMTVPNGQGVAVPLSTVVSASWEAGMEQSTRFNGYPAMSISGAVKPGFASGDAMAEVERIVSQMDGYSVEWAGESRQQASGSSQRTMLYGFVLLATFLVLAALYESWSIPAAVLLVAPLGFLGVVLGVFGRNLFNGVFHIREVFFNDIYFMVGMITVVGLSAKNAILIIEFAKDLQAQGKSAMESALAAAHLRFRPILMTSFAFILGVVPLYIASGASSASQRAIGTTVFWGMSVGTLLSVFLVPLFYVLVRKLFKPSQHETEMAAAHTNISPEQAELYVSAAEQGLSEEEKRDLHNDQ
ncbi:efflux RND transporter permease subunit, partial [Eikenella corrodens]|nr:efflux RND transporter permease subunit [Eikenella corrodens]